MAVNITQDWYRHKSYLGSPSICINLILFTVLVHLILRISPHHSHHFRSHHLSLPLPFTPDLKLISFTNPFLHSHSYSFRTDFTDLNLYWIKGAQLCFSFCYVSRLSCILSFRVHVKLFYCIVSYEGLLTLHDIHQFLQLKLLISCDCRYTLIFCSHLRQFLVVKLCRVVAGGKCCDFCCRIYGGGSKPSNSMDFDLTAQPQCFTTVTDSVTHFICDVIVTMRYILHALKAGGKQV